MTRAAELNVSEAVLADRAACLFTSLKTGDRISKGIASSVELLELKNETAPSGFVAHRRLPASPQTLRSLASTSRDTSGEALSISTAARKLVAASAAPMSVVSRTRSQGSTPSLLTILSTADPPTPLRA